MNYKSIDEERGRNSLLDVIKGVCILFVIISHCNFSDEERLHLFFPFWIDMAVPMFMIISGYVGALSFDCKNIRNLKECYKKEILISKISRLTIPFIIVCIIEFIADCFISGRVSIADFFFLIIYGGRGPGSYYYPIMMQFVFLYPLIYFIIKDSKIRGVLILFIVNGLYELFAHFLTVPDSLNRLLLLRWIFVISSGCFLYLDRTSEFKKRLILKCVMGGGRNGIYLNY